MLAQRNTLPIAFMILLALGSGSESQEPSNKVVNGRPVPAELRGEHTVVYAVPSGYDWPVTYVDSERVRVDSTKMIWPPVDAPVIPSGHRLTIQIVEPTRQSPDFSIVSRLLDNDLIALNIYDNTLDEKAMRDLRRFREVQYLGCKIQTDQEISRICDTWPELVTVGMGELSAESPLTDRGLAALSKLSKLRATKIQGSRFSADGFRSLAAIPTLEGIAFAGNRTVRGDDIRALAQLPRLREVVLWTPADFGDADLLQFAECKALQHVCLFGSERVTPGGINALRAALPRCIVHVRSELGVPQYNDLRN